MPKKLKTTRRAVLRLPDLDYSKSAVLNTLRSPGSRRAYEFALNEFIAWYCSEPRLAFNRVVVVRYRLALEARGLAASSINQRLAAVRRLAYEAAVVGPNNTGLNRKVVIGAHAPATTSSHGGLYLLSRPRFDPLPVIP